MTNPKTSPLLPNLRHLIIRSPQDTPDGFATALLFLGPKVHTLELNNGHGASVQWEKAFSSRIGAISPHIRVFKSEWSSASIATCCTEVLRALPDLQEVEIECTSDAQDFTSPILASATLPSLERFSLRALWGESAVAFRWASSFPAPYQNLRSLNLVCLLLEGLTALLDSIGASPRLTHLSLGSGDEYLYMRLPIKDVLIKAGMQTSLETLSICAADEIAPIGTLVAADLMAIHSCSALQTLSIQTLGCVELSDTEIESLVKHLPRLQHLNLLGYDFLDMRTASLSLEAYAAIATACSSIQSIGLCVDATRIPSLTRLFEAPHTLSCLKVLQSPIKDAHAVALFIDQLSAAENVRVVCNHDMRVNPKERKLWDEVSALLTTLRIARENEREKMARRQA